MKGKRGFCILFFCMFLCVLIRPGRMDAADPTVTYISAVYQGDAVEVGGSIPRDKISVTATYSDNTTAEIKDFVMSTERVLAEGSKQGDDYLSREGNGDLCVRQKAKFTLCYVHRGYTQCRQ